MDTNLSGAPAVLSARSIRPGMIVTIGLIVFSLLFLVVDQAWFGFANVRFPNVGESTRLANLWGILSRLHNLLILAAALLWRRDLLALRRGRIGRHWRLLLGMLLANLAIIGAYLWLSGSPTPYSGDQWLLTEIVTVPVVEELFWRGLVFSVALAALRRSYKEGTVQHITVWSTGLAYGLLHASNALSGVPLGLALLQAVNASIWGVVYGYARAKSDSVHPALVMHAAMNLLVVLV